MKMKKGPGRPAKDITRAALPEGSRLTVIRMLPEKIRDQGYYCLCQCSCGNTVKLAAYSVLYGRTKSCGCLKKEVSQQQRNITLRERVVRLRGEGKTQEQIGRLIGRSPQRVSQILKTESP